MNTWILAAIAFFHFFGAMATIASIGKERKPLTPQVAVVSVIISTCIIAALLSVIF